MADKKISALTGSATPLAGTEVLPIVQSGATVKVSVANLTAGRSVSSSALTSTGTSFIGTTSAIGGANAYLHVFMDDGGKNGLAVGNSTGAAATVAVRFLNSNATVGSIITSGVTTAYNISSDARLKYDIADAASAGDVFDAIKVRKFKWKSDNSEQRFGFVAQELLEFVPEAVSVLPGADDMMGVDYSELVPLLVKEIQDLRARVSRLEI